ncbi:C4-dicarboxylate ABC transporter [Polaromonas sp.]|uniref:SLAC1 family transporter n=1 Tax=Polaromonas sp. TaxID=1869339 RepID=UPI001D759364|nr:C4-dicarboxylate ABC transporter [Polaromonas sp.]MBT9475829.1 C4-dicarboxylate ABC transporter [Polaromonas sp.]
MPHHPTALKFLMPGWFVVVMGLSGLSLAWHSAVPILGDTAGAGAMVLGALAALVFALLAGLSLLRWQRYPLALADDLKHPVRHPLVAALPASLLLLATVATALTGAGTPARVLWVLGAAWQFGVTVWVLSRWLKGNKEGGLVWPSLTPLMLIPVVGNMLAPLAGVALGSSQWSAAQLGLGLLLWPVLLTLLAVRVGTAGLWPERLLASTFITVSPPAVAGLAALQLGASPLLSWMAWGVALFFLVWSAGIFKRAISQPFSVTLWALSFPLAAFAALTLQLAPHAARWFQPLAMLVLALTTLVIAALSLATVKGLREGTLLAPEPVAMITPAGA